MMDTVLFTDYGIVVFAITTSAIALILSVLGLGLRTLSNRDSRAISVKRSTAHQFAATTSQYKRVPRPSAGPRGASGTFASLKHVS
jgi:hypothetical protein